MWFFLSFFFVVGLFLQYKKIGTVFFSQRRRLVQPGRGQKGPDSETYEQNTLRGDDREIKAGKQSQPILTRGTEGGGFDGQM